MYVATYYSYNLSQIFDSVDTCIKWHNEHPVTAREIFRNNTVYGLQKNRNPYVDHPSYANSVFGGNYTEPDPITGNVPDPDDPPVNPEVPTTGMVLNCRRDYDIPSQMWERFGFIASGNHRSRSYDEHSEHQFLKTDPGNIH